jgi:NAD(P)-dependent dehydrogenase (short-subunit alcohol dehydrogenase family)
MLDKMNVLITGATSGIGEALLNQYVVSGHNVIACGRNKDKLAELDAVARLTLAFDVNNNDEVASAAQTLTDSLDNGTDGESDKVLDVLILNAGDCRYIQDPINFDAELFADIINTNLISLGSLLKFFLPKVKKGGQVVFISSSASIGPFPQAEAYGASKAGVDYLANSLRVDLAAHNIGVTLVHPGFVRTPLTSVNHFNMPFIIDASDAAARIFNGVQAKKNYLHFPKRLTVSLKLLSLLPASIWQRLFSSGSDSEATPSKPTDLNDTHTRDEAIATDTKDLKK